jgi:hypothetical protein
VLAYRPHEKTRRLRAAFCFGAFDLSMVPDSLWTTYGIVAQPGSSTCPSNSLRLVETMEINED